MPCYDTSSSAIAEAHSALQSIASRLFLHGEKSVELCRLPSLWMHELLQRLASEQQVFILRRSAGFAYSFVSLLRAEPINCKVTLLPLAMRELLRHVAQGLADAETQGLADGALTEQEQGLAHETDTRVATSTNTRASTSTTASTGTGARASTSSWRMCVHALNVLRMILIDATLGPDLDAFIAGDDQHTL